MRALQRVAVAIGVGAVLALVHRLRGSLPAPSGSGGWRELDEAALTDGDVPR